MALCSFLSNFCLNWCILIMKLNLYFWIPSFWINSWEMMSFDWAGLNPDTRVHLYSDLRVCKSIWSKKLKNWRKSINLFFIKKTCQTHNIEIQCMPGFSVGIKKSFNNFFSFIKRLLYLISVSAQKFTILVISENHDRWLGCLVAGGNYALNRLSAYLSKNEFCLTGLTVVQTFGPPEK